MTIQEKATEYFAQHPTVNAFFFTSDGQAFFETRFAEAHAIHLKDATITTIERGFDKPKPVEVTVTIDKLIDGVNIQTQAPEAIQEAVTEAMTTAIKSADNAQPATIEAPKKAAHKKAATKK